MTKSEEYTLITQDIKKISIGALIAAGGAAVTYLIDAIPSVNLGQYTYVVMPILSVLLNAVRKYLTETTYK